MLGFFVFLSIVPIQQKTQLKILFLAIISQLALKNFLSKMCRHLFCNVASSILYCSFYPAWTLAALWCIEQENWKKKKSNTPPNVVVRFSVAQVLEGRENGKRISSLLNSSVLSNIDSACMILGIKISEPDCNSIDLLKKFSRSIHKVVSKIGKAVLFLWDPSYHVCFPPKQDASPPPPSVTNSDPPGLAI